MTRTVLTLLVSIALLLTSGAAASAATPSTVTISATVYVGRAPTASPTATPGEEVVLNGAVTFSPGRVMVLQQRIGAAWREVARRPVQARWRFPVVARTPGRRLYRVVALRTWRSEQAISPARVVTVVQPVISVTATGTPKGSPLTGFTGRAVPARPGRPVQLWELRGPRWVTVADALQAEDGGFDMRVVAGAKGVHTYRAVTSSPAGQTAVRSRTRLVTTSAPVGGGSAYLADVSPHTCLTCLPVYDSTGLVDGPAYETGPVTVAGRAWVRSVRSTAPRLAFALGGTSTSLGTAITLQAAPKARLRRVGPRLVEVRVDGRLRLRTYLRDGQTLPLVLDLRGAREVRFTSYDRGGLDLSTGSDLVLLTPVLGSAVRPERGVDVTTALSELPRAATSGRELQQGLVGSVARTLHGGSLLLGSDNSSTSASSAGAEYDLSARFTRLTGFPMLYGETAPGLSGTVRLLGDGRLLADLPAAAEGAEQLASVDVTGVRRLRVELVAQPVDRETGWTFSWYVALGDPRLR